MKLEIKSVTERDLRRDLELNEDELDELIEHIETIAKISIPADIRDILNNMVGILRYKFFIDQNRIRNEEVYEDLRKLRNLAIGIYDILDKGISSKTQSELSMLSLQMNYVDNDDHLYHCAKHTQFIPDMCQRVEEKLKQNSNKNNAYNLKNIRDILAVEIARVLAPLGLNISTYEQSDFRACLEAFYESCEGQTKLGKVTITTPQNFFPILKKAQEEYENSDLFALLAIN